MTTQQNGDPLLTFDFDDSFLTFGFFTFKFFQLLTLISMTTSGLFVWRSPHRRRLLHLGARGDGEEQGALHAGSAKVAVWKSFGPRA